MTIALCEFNTALIPEAVPVSVSFKLEILRKTVSRPPVK